METNTQQDIRQKVKRLLNKVHGLPTLPNILNRMNKMMINPRTSARDVAQLISSDPAIASRVLRVVNSSFYGFPSRITTITHAIVILGFNTVKSIVLSSSIFDVFKGDPRQASFDRAAFWKHSIGCGSAAKVLGHRLRYPTTEELFIAGLLHDVGKIVLDQFLHDQFNEVLRRTRQNDTLILHAEEEMLGVTHADIGASLFEKWNLSKGLIECTRYHHNPMMADENQKPVAIIHLSDILTRAVRFGSGGDGKIPLVSDSAWEQLGLRPDRFDDILKETGEEIERAMVFLDFI